MKKQISKVQKGYKKLWNFFSSQVAGSSTKPTPQLDPDDGGDDDDDNCDDDDDDETQLQ